MPRPPEPDRVATPPHARVAVQVILVAVTVATGVWMLYRLERVGALLTLTTFFAYLVAPLVRLAEQPIRLAGMARADSSPRVLSVEGRASLPARGCGRWREIQNV